MFCCLARQAWRYVGVSLRNSPGTIMALIHSVLTGDGRVVTGGYDGRVYCARLEGGDPILLAHHGAEYGIWPLPATGVS